MGCLGTMICQHTGTVSATIRKSPNGTNARVIDADNKLWSVDFDYGTMTGAAACNTLSGVINTAHTGMFTYATDHGANCWCAMQRPISSYWVFYTTYEDSDSCEENCTLRCAQITASNENSFRYALMDSIW